MSFEPRDYLRYIVVEADYLLARSAALTFDAFTGDETLRRAFVRSLEIIGEAAKKVPSDFREQHPNEVPSGFSAGPRPVLRPAALPWYYEAMAIAYSKLTAQGQISVPSEIRRKLGIGPGSILEWEQEGDQVVVRRAGRYTSEDVHRALFEQPPPPRSLEELREGVRRYVKGRHARH